MCFCHIHWRLGGLVIGVGGMVLVAGLPAADAQGTVTTGLFHSCVVTAANGAKCWGGNDSGQLGTGSYTSTLVPVDVQGLTSGVAAVASYNNHTCTLTASGGIWCSGPNGWGQLGNGTWVGSASPVSVSGLSSGVSSIAVGWTHACGVTATGGARCWGYNSEGELGDDTTINRNTPVDVVGLTSGVSRVVTGKSHSCALTTGGGVLCWGRNTQGQLGDNSTTQRRTPVQVVGLTSGVVALAAGEGHTCALTSTGSMKCWGGNGYGQLGDGSTDNRLVPVDVAGLTSGVMSIGSGGYHTCAVTTGGGVRCWGGNWFGALGDNSTEQRTTPVSVVGLDAGVTAVDGAVYHTCARLLSGNVKCWGQNTFGQLGDGSTSNSPVPVDVVGLTPAPTLTPSPAAVNIGAVNDGGTLTSATPAQTVTVSQSGGTGVAWTASADVSWLTIAAADAVGNGTGTFTVTLNNTGNALPATGTVNGTITITAPGAQSNPTIPVRATLYAPGGTLPPFGLTSSPDQNAAGVQGAVGITGWVVDDVGIERVRLYRNCLAFEDQNACQTVAGQTVVWMGDATLVAGARPDIEGAYPTYPQNNRAGFGYAMLSNLSPHIPNQEMFGGQGPLTISIRVRDIEGNEAWVGRNFVGGSTTLSDEVPTAITMANDTIAKPFGTIDTPTQGQTVGGAFWNWGWALTPDSNTTAGAGDILIPTNGSTITVWIDGAARGTVTYNQCRGAMAPFCIDDIASIFGNPTPQPIGTPRANNPTEFRNLDANRGAIGGFFLDTAAFTNAVHTIAWAAYDNGVPPRGDGLGSRYFTVLNAGTRDQGPGTSSVTLSRRDETDPGSRVPGPESAAEVRGRTGFDLHAPFAVLNPGADGIRRVQIDEMGRLELQFLWVGRALSPALSRVEGPSPASSGAFGELALPYVVEQGYLVVNGEYRPLPVGSQFDAETGTFTWAPGVGFIGTYRLAFGSPTQESGAPPSPDALPRGFGEAGRSQESGGNATTPDSRIANPGKDLVLVDVTIRPASTPAPGEATVRMSLDTPQPGATVSGSFLVAGWALDPHAAIGSGIAAVHVWAQRTDVPGEAPVFLGAAELGGSRPDVAGIYGAQFGNPGYNLSASALPPGTYDVTAYVWNTRTARWEDARTVSVIAR